MRIMPRLVTLSCSAWTTVAGPPWTQPRLLSDEWTITVSPGPTPRHFRSALREESVQAGRGLASLVFIEEPVSMCTYNNRHCASPRDVRCTKSAAFPNDASPDP